MKDVTGKEELARLSFDWSSQKPGLVLTFSTFCCASGTCGDYMIRAEKYDEDRREIDNHYDKRSAAEVKKSFGRLR